MGKLIATEHQGFEQIRHTDEAGNEYWFARELAPVLEYAEWRNFSKVIDRAMLACRNSGFNVSDHFVEVNKTVEMPVKPRKAPEIGFVDLNKTKTKTILDYMNSQELIANLFRISLAEEKIRVERIYRVDAALKTHNDVGYEVRQTIERVGGVLSVPV